MIDLHTHTLFGIDDGAKTIDESLEMLIAQINEGVSEVVLAPHFNCGSDDVDKFVKLTKKNYTLLNKQVKQKGLNINLRLGSEVLYCSNILDVDLENLTIEGTDYLLLEFNTNSFPVNIKRNISSLLNRGYLIIFAHVERYAFLRNDLELFKELVEMGVLMQINANTLINNYDKSFIRACIKHNLIHLISSDAHNITTRPANLKAGYTTLKKSYGSDVYDYFMTNAKSVLNNEIIEMYSPSLIRKFGKRYF